jgi:hypothetical protein
VRVIKYCEQGIVPQVTLLDDTGREVVQVTRFLSHLTDSAYSPNTVCGYAYDLRHLAVPVGGRSTTGMPYTSRQTTPALVWWS